MEAIKKIIKEILPPILHRAYKYLRRNSNQFSGPYATWDDARQSSTGYDSDLILEKVLQNIGLDSSGVHSGTSTRFGSYVAADSIHIETIPIEEDQIARRQIQHCIKSLRSHLLVRCGRKIRNYVKGLLGKARFGNRSKIN